MSFWQKISLQDAPEVTILTTGASTDGHSLKERNFRFSVTMFYMYVNFVIRKPTKLEEMSVIFSTSKFHKNQRSILLALCEGNPPMDSPHKGTVIWNVSPYHDVIMCVVYWHINARFGIGYAGVYLLTHADYNVVNPYHAVITRVLL